MSFLDDLVPGLPVRVDLFDEAVVLLRRPDGTCTAMLDRCPHRGAALSEGRMTASGALQCAYHGWCFDSSTGACTKIPQVRPGTKVSGRTCGTAFPVTVQQGIVWMWPQPVTAGTPPPDTSTIPTLPQLDQGGWVADDYVRDFPLDYTLLAENVMDPDHGLFAHQVVTFDMYAASPDEAMKLEVDSGPNSFRLQSTVAAVPKLLQPADAAAVRGPNGEGATAIIEFKAPVYVKWMRVEGNGVPSPLIMVFYVLPLGFGRSRLLLRSVRSVAAGVKLPRWLFATFLNKFLDQDSYLVATQQDVTLTAELQNHYRSSSSSAGSSSGPITTPEQAVLAENGGTSAPSPNTAATGGAVTRRQLFCHKSPSDALLVAAGKWLDNHLPSMPNRYLNTQGMEAFRAAPREEVLDRFKYHTAICPSSKGAYNTAVSLHRALQPASWAAASAAAAYLACTSSQGLDFPAALAATLPLAATAGLLAAAAAVANQVATSFVYCYTRQDQAKDLTKLVQLTNE